MKHFIVIIDETSRITEIDGPFNELEASYIAKLLVIIPAHFICLWERLGC